MKRTPWGCLVPVIVVGGLVAALAPQVQKARDAARMAQLT